MTPPKKTSAVDLRRQAEARLKENKKGKTPAPETDLDVLGLVHELEVHQIELDMQNDELKRAQAATEAAFQRYADLYDFAPVGYFTLARDGAIGQVNFTGSDLLGVERSKLIQTRFGLFVDPASRPEFNAFLEKVFSAVGQKATCEVKLLKDNDESLWTHIAATSNTAGTCRVIVSDITERKKAEEEIQQLNARLEQRVEERTRELREAQEKIVRQEKLSLLGQMAGSVGHELRNPLGVITNTVYLLKISQPDASDKIKEHLQLIEKQVRISAKIISDLLDLTHIKPVEPAAVSVAQLVREALERFPAPESVQVTLDLPADLPQVYADPQHIVQILGNLIINACQAMMAGGKLTISGRQSSVGSNPPAGTSQSLVLSPVEGSVKTDPLITAPPITAHWLLITVTDTGAGIAPENMKKLFEPLFSTKIDGVGLGLVVCQNLAEVNGGRIEVESDPGKGSTFSVYVPVYKDIKPGKE